MRARFFFTPENSLNFSFFSDLDKVSRGNGDKIGSFVMWVTVFLGGLIIGFIAEWRLSLFILGLTPILAILGVIEAKEIEKHF